MRPTAGERSAEHSKEPRDRKMMKASRRQESRAYKQMQLKQEQDQEDDYQQQLQQHQHTSTSTTGAKGHKSSLHRLQTSSSERLRGDFSESSKQLQEQMHTTQQKIQQELRAQQLQATGRLEQLSQLEQQNLQKMDRNAEYIIHNQ